MRIVIDLQAYQCHGSRNRGIGRYARAFTGALLKIGKAHDFWVVVSDRYPETIDPIRRELAGLIEQSRIVVMHVPENVVATHGPSAWRSRAAEALREHFLASLRPDVLFLPSLFEGFEEDCVTSIGRQSIPTAVAVHDLIPLLRPETYITGGVGRACYNRKLLSLRRADLWLAVSDHSRREACELLSLPSDRVVSTSEAVEADVFKQISYPEEERLALRERLGISRPFVMFTSAIEHRKNVNGLVYAFGAMAAELRRRHQLVLVGSIGDDTRGHLADHARKAGMDPDELVLTGRVSDQDLVALYNQCELFVFPSFHEGFGLPVLEAMSCGAPVIGSSVTSIPEVIGRADLMFDPNSTQEMSTLMARVLGDEAFKASLRAYGLERVKAFSWEVSAQRALDAFSTKLPARPAAPRPGLGGARPRLAYVAPLPPLDTPAARRATALLPELATRYDIELVVDQPEVDAAWLTANFTVRSTDWLREHWSQLDRIVYDLDESFPGGIELMSSAPGVVLLDRLIVPDQRADLDDVAFLSAMYEAHGFDGMAFAAERGRAAAAAAYPVNQATLAEAAGVIVLSEAVRDEARAWLGEHVVDGWRSFVGLDAGARAAAEDLASGVETFALHGPVARTRRMLADISAECSVEPSEEDLATVVRCIAANTRPAGRPQLLFDVSSYFEPNARAREKRATLKQIVGLTRADLFGYRVEPVYLDGDRFRYARRLTCEALGLADIRLEDDCVEVFPEDVFLSLTAPSDAHLPALAELKQHGVKTLCVIADEPGLLAPLLLPDLAPVLRRWIEQVCALDVDGGLWLSPTSRGALNTPAGGEQTAAGVAILERLRSAWNAGVETAALVIGRRGPVLAALSVRDARAFSLAGRLFDFELKRDKAFEAGLFRALDATPSGGAAKHDYNFTVTGHVLGHYSLALVNRAVARTIEDMRPGKVRLVPVESRRLASLDGVPASARAEMKALARRPSFASGLSVLISQHYPVLIPDGAADISLALFPWEESHVPSEIVRDLTAGYDGVLATSQFTAKALIDSGLTIPTISIGQPPEISDFAALGRERRQPGDPFVFLHVSSAFPRKGIDVLLAAWARAFRRKDRVRLVIKTFPNPHNDAAEQVARLRREHRGCAEIELIDQEIDHVDLMNLYRRADAVVSPSRGEGYNLPALEAMAAGIPLIVTGHGGHLDFCGPEEARLVRCQMAFSKSHVAGEKALWAEPDVDDLTAALREMIDPNERGAIVARTVRARSAALAVADPARWVNRLETVVGHLADRRPPSPPRVAWISTWDQQCGIAEYSRYLLDHFSDAARANTVVLCDERIPAGVRGGLRAIPCWKSGSANAGYSEWGGIVPAVLQQGAEMVVIQHQDGLFPFWAMGDIIADLRERGVLSMVTMHNCAQMPNTPLAEQERTARGLKKAARVLVHTLADVNTLMKLGVSDNVVLLPHGASRAPITAEVRDLTAATTGPVIGCFGFFVPGKGIDHLIRAYAELRRQWPGLQLRLVNARFPDIKSDVEIDRCRKIAEKLGVAKDIEWHLDFLPLDEISRLLAGCDVLVMAYDDRTDSVSGAVRVAMSSLVPVLATRIAFFEELGDAVGWLESNEPSGIAKSIEAMLRDQGRRREIQVRAAAWLDAHDWSTVAARLESMAGGLIEAQRLEAAIQETEVREALREPREKAASEGLLSREAVG